LYPNYPNPFNAETNIEYALPENAKVKLGIFNLRGQLVKVLVNDEQKAGIKKVRWDGKNGEGKEVGSGVYFLRLEIGEQKLSRKITLQK
jgi:flagellar hook assembly protein FlgD